MKQIQLMLLHTTTEVRESLGGGGAAAGACAGAEHLVGKPVDVAERRRADPGRRRLARRQRLHPDRSDSTLQEGDFLIVMIGKDHMAELEAMLEAPAEHH